ncbi:MAG TPA: disulfide bond formation protein B [Xanthobacteraceae bacterium]
MTVIASSLGRFRAAPLSAAGFAIAAAAAATLAGAWFFELVLGLAPCPLCLDQRVPYYIAVPLGLAVGWLARDRARAPIARLGLALLGLILLIGAGYGIYHAGVEWGFWQGPTACAGAGATSSAPAGSILSSLKGTQRVVSCSEAAWRFLGISLAGYNVLIAGALSLLAFAAAAGRLGRA